MPDSSQAGYLRPTDLAPLYDDDLEDLFQAVVVGITGIAGSLVRPRWQADPPNLPDPSINWIALGVTLADRQWDAYRRFDPLLGGGDGSYVQEGTEVLEVNLSFYGPAHSRVRRELEDGLLIEQNRDALEAQKIKYVECLKPVQVPVLLKHQWHMRSDVRAVFRRYVRRLYPILSLRSASVSLDNERYVTQINVTP